MEPCVPDESLEALKRRIYAGVRRMADESGDRQRESRAAMDRADRTLAAYGKRARPG